MTRRFRILALALMVLAVLAACGLAQNRAALPAVTASDVKYGLYPANVLDFWQAKSEKPAPLFIFIHPGGFTMGKRWNLQAAALKRALDAGASVASIEYRFIKDAPIQDILRDCARSVQFMRHNAVKYHLDPKRIACFGGSAGAGASLWIAVHPDLADPKSTDPVLRESSRIAAAACINGQATYNLTEWDTLIYPAKPEWKRPEAELLQWYHFKSAADLTSEAGRKILADCSMYDLLTKDDPPIWMYCALPEGKPTNENHLIHHPKHCQVIKQRGDAVGAKVEIHLHNEGKENAQVMAVEFLLKQVGLAAGETTRAAP